MKGPSIGPVGEDITWPDQVPPGAEERLVPETSNPKPQTSDLHVFSKSRFGFSHAPTDHGPYIRLRILDTIFPN